MNGTIVFTDYGQSFLEFDVVNSRVTEVRPIPSEFYHRAMILNKRLLPGDKVRVKTGTKESGWHEPHEIKQEIRRFIPA